MKKILEFVTTPWGDTMYFVKGKEVSEPLLLPTPIKIAGDTQVVAFSEGGLRAMCLFTKVDVKDLPLKTAAEIPKLLLDLTH